MTLDNHPENCRIRYGLANPFALQLSCELDEGTGGEGENIPGMAPLHEGPPDITH